MISVSTEISDRRVGEIRGWVLYDGTCQFCRSWVLRLQPILAPRGFTFLALQTPWVREHFRLPEEQLLSEMRLLLPTGEVYDGADAIVALARYVWWARLFALAAVLPGVRPLLRAAYRYVARHRTCSSHACSSEFRVPPTNEGGLTP